MALTKSGPTKSPRRASGSEARQDSRAASAGRTQCKTEVTGRIQDSRCVTKHPGISRNKGTIRADHVGSVPSTSTKMSVRGAVSGAEAERSRRREYANVEMDADTDEEEEEEDGGDDEDGEDEEEDSDASGHDPAFTEKPFPFNDAFLDSENGKSLALLLEPDTKSPARIPVVRPTDGPPISLAPPSIPPEWPHPPHSSTWELFVLASAHVLSQYPATDHATLARELAAEILPQRTRTSSRVVPRFLAEDALRARYGILPHTDELPNMFTSTCGAKRPGLLVRATAHILRACPDMGHGDLASLLARAATFDGNKAVVQLVRDIQDSSLCVSSASPPRVVLCTEPVISSSHSSTACRSVSSTHATSRGPPTPPPPLPTAFNRTTEPPLHASHASEQISPIHAPHIPTLPFPRFRGHSQVAPAPKSPIRTPYDIPQPSRARPQPRTYTPEPSSTPFRPAAVPSEPSPASVPSPASPVASVPPTASPVPSPTVQVLALLSGLPPAKCARLALRLAGELAADAARTFGGVLLRAVRARIEGQGGDVHKETESTGARNARCQEPLPSATRARSPHSASSPPNISVSTLGRKRPANPSMSAHEPPAKRVRPGIPLPTAYAAAAAPRSHEYVDHDEDNKARLRQQQPQRRAYVAAQAQAAASAKAWRARRS